MILIQWDITPKTAENFRALCTGEKGIGKLGKPLHYKDCNFHRFVTNHLIYGGDIVNNYGTGNESIYGKKFKHENYIMKHSRRGQLSMVNGTYSYFLFFPLYYLSHWFSCFIYI
jgi:cyclophilin family peptidyl-prolyl cis-trans isomerase